MLSKEDVLGMVDKASNVRDKAFISTLYESGSRISEMMGLRVRDVKFKESNAVLSISGRTGLRKIPIKISSRFLESWLDEHPDKSDGHSYLWTHLDSPRLLSRKYCSKILKKAAGKAGVSKNVTPTLFRHSRIMHLIEELSAVQLKYFFGVSPFSRELDKYSYSINLDDAILRMYGIKKKRE